MSVAAIESGEVTISPVTEAEDGISLGKDALSGNGNGDEGDAAVGLEMDKVVNEFRAALDDIELDEHLRTDRELLRWLKARSMDLKMAEGMLRSSMDWRETNEIDTILEWKPPLHFLKDFPFQICGFDADGDQFGVVTWSKWDIESFIQSIPIDQGKTHIRYFWQCLETVKKIMRAHSTAEKSIHSGVVIIDMDGLAITQFASREIIEVVLEATRQYEANYPGFLKKAIVVNTPKVFTMLYSLMRPFLSEETAASVEIYGYYDDWRGALRACLPVEQLPSRHGGANTTVKPYHPSQGFAVTVPVFEEIDPSTLKPTNVPAGQKLDLDFTVSEVNSKLSWAFRTDDYDIGFGVFHVPESGGAETEVVDFCRVDSHIVLQRGLLVCEQTGKYIFRFDNVSSWIRPKSLYYSINQA